MTMTLDTAPADLDLFAGADPTEVDASIASDGLTIDTVFGPVDLIAVQHALEHRPVDLSRAERWYVARLRENGVGKAVA